MNAADTRLQKLSPTFPVGRIVGNALIIVEVQPDFIGDLLWQFEDIGYSTTQEVRRNAIPDHLLMVWRQGAAEQLRAEEAENGYYIVSAILKRCS